MITQSAQFATMAALDRAGYTAQQLVEARLTPEQARDVIGVKTQQTVRIPAGCIEWAMSEYKRRQAGGDEPYDEATGFDVLCDFQADPLGRWHTAQTGVTGKPTTDLYKLIANQRV